MSATPVLLIAAPGVGKSAGLEAYAKMKKKPFISMVVSQCDPVDLCGVVMPDDGKETCSRRVPDWWLRACESPHIILFDELTAADSSQFSAVLRAWDDSREICGKKLHEETETFGACNPPEFAAGAARELSAPVLSRCRIRYIGIESALAWMHGDEGLFGTPGCQHPAVRVVAEYLINNNKEAALAKPEEMQKAVEEQKPFPTPRCWTRAAMECGLEGMGDWHEFVGLPAASAFNNFIKLLDLPNVVDILAGRCPDVPDRGDAVMVTAGSISAMLCGHEQSKESIKHACKWFNAAAKVGFVAAVFPALNQIIEKLGDNTLGELDYTPFIPALKVAGKL